MAKRKKKAAARATSRKRTAKTRGPGGSRGSRSGGGPIPISTGRGPSPAEVGGDLVAMFNGGQFKEVEDKYWSPAIESVEGVGVSQAWRGRRAVEGKNAWWMSDHVMHGGSAEGPYVGASGFAVKFRLDVETKSTGQRQMMEEIGVYTVKNGKIIREEFMYSAGGSGSEAPATA